MTTRIVYQGPSTAVEIAATGQVAVRGEPVDVDDDLAANLLAQGTQHPRGGTPIPPDPKTATWVRASKPAKESD